MARKDEKEKAEKIEALKVRAIAVGLDPETATEEEIEKAEAGKGGSSENIENIEETPEVTSVLSKDEFRSRLKEALEKHKPEGIEETPEEDREKVLNAAVRQLGLQIANEFDKPTAEVIELVGLMLKGEYQNDKMLVLFEEMPIGGYGY